MNENNLKYFFFGFSIKIVKIELFSRAVANNKETIVKIEAFELIANLKLENFRFAIIWYVFNFLKGDNFWRVINVRS